MEAGHSPSATLSNSQLEILKRPLSILACCLLISSTVSAQTRIGLKAGACLPGLDNIKAEEVLEEVRQADLFSAGLAFRIPLDAHFHLQPELLVRSRNRWQPEPTGQTMLSTDLQLPILLQAGLYAGPVELFLQGGPYFSTRLSDHDCSVSETLDLIGHYFRHFHLDSPQRTMGLCLGLGAQIWNIQADLRWYWDNSELQHISLSPLVLQNLDCCLSLTVLF